MYFWLKEEYARINGNLVSRGNFGPYRIRFTGSQNASQCLVANATDIGPENCGANDNTWQQWYYSPVTGNLRNVQQNKCLMVKDNGKWGMENCNDWSTQAFFRQENLLKYRGNQCLDYADGNRHYSCDSNSGNQQVQFEFVG